MSSEGEDRPERRPAPALRIREIPSDPVRSRKKAGKRVWPMTEIDPQKMRDHNWAHQVANNLATTPSEERCGILGRSVLFDIPHFDIIRDVPPDYM